jgi:hypothetical protein
MGTDQVGDRSAGYTRCCLHPRLHSLTHAKLASKDISIMEDHAIKLSELKVDAHTHLLPLRLAQKVRTFFETNGMVVRHDQPGSCCSPPGPSSDPPRLLFPVDPYQLKTFLAPTDADPKQPWSRTLWTLPYAHKAGMSTSLNRDIRALAQDVSERSERTLKILPGFTVHPEDVDVGQVVESALRAGARVCKLHVSVGRLSVIDERLASVCLPFQTQVVSATRI